MRAPVLQRAQPRAAPGQRDRAAVHGDTADPALGRDVHRVDPVPAACVHASRLLQRRCQNRHGHPGGAVGLLEPPARGERHGPVEIGLDVVEPEEPSLEDVAPFGVLAVDPPREVEEQLVADALEKLEVPPPR